MFPNFPFIVGAAVIASWNSAYCGTCWQLTYEGTSINILAIDHAADGFDITLEAINKLTNGQAVELVRIAVLAQQVETSVCGL